MVERVVRGGAHAEISVLAGHSWTATLAPEDFILEAGIRKPAGPHLPKA